MTALTRLVKLEAKGIEPSFGLIEGTLRDSRKLLMCRDHYCGYQESEGLHYTLDCEAWKQNKQPAEYGEPH